MGAAVHPISILAITALWLVMVPTAFVGVGLVLAAGGLLLFLDGLCSLVRGAIGLATGAAFGDVLDPAVHA